MKRNIIIALLAISLLIIGISYHNTHNFKSADINKDGVVDIRDFGLLKAKYGQTGSNLGRADINHDGKVDYKDLSILSNQFKTN